MHNCDDSVITENTEKATLMYKELYLTYSATFSNLYLRLLISSLHRPHYTSRYGAYLQLQCDKRPSRDAFSLYYKVISGK